MKKRNKAALERTPDRCPFCRSSKVHAVGEFRNNQIPYRCDNCRSNYNLIFQISGVAGDTYMATFDNNDNNVTMELLWFEIHGPIPLQPSLLCPGCFDIWRSLYVLETTPERAEVNPDALCFACSGVVNWFPGWQPIELPIVIRRDL